jgi:hypothetical protein
LKFIKKKIEQMSAHYLKPLSRLEKCDSDVRTGIKDEKRHTIEATKMVLPSLGKASDIHIHHASLGRHSLDGPE